MEIPSHKPAISQFCFFNPLGQFGGLYIVSTEGEQAQAIFPRANKLQDLSYQS